MIKRKQIAVIEVVMLIKEDYNNSIFLIQWHALNEYRRNIRFNLNVEVINHGFGVFSY